MAKKTIITIILLDILITISVFFFFFVKCPGKVGTSFEIRAIALKRFTKNFSKDDFTDLKKTGNIFKTLSKRSINPDFFLSHHTIGLQDFINEKNFFYTAGDDHLKYSVYLIYTKFLKKQASNLKNILKKINNSSNTTELDSAITKYIITAISIKNYLLNITNIVYNIFFLFQSILFIGLGIFIYRKNKKNAKFIVIVNVIVLTYIFSMASVVPKINFHYFSAFLRTKIFKAYQNKELIKRLSDNFKNSGMFYYKYEYNNTDYYFLINRKAKNYLKNFYEKIKVLKRIFTYANLSWNNLKDNLRFLSDDIFITSEKYNDSVIFLLFFLLPASLAIYLIPLDEEKK